MTAIVASIHLDTRELDRITKELRPRAQKILKAGAFAVGAKAQAVIQAKHIWDTGALYNSITPRQVAEWTWWVEDANLDYGLFIELGHDTRGHGRHIAARPFMTPAVEWAKPHFEESWKELFE